MPWYVAALKSGRERVAITGLGEQGFGCYYPQMIVPVALHGRWHDRSEPVFPCYLFLFAEPDASAWRSINNTRGVIRLLGNDAPCPVPEREINSLQQRERAGLLRHPRRRAVRSGDLVEFRHGTFTGLQGICQWTKRERIGVLLQMLGGGTVVTSPRDWLKLAVA